MNNKINIECNYVQLSESNLHYFLPLFKSAFKKNISLIEVQKKYNFSFLNKPYLGLFALYNGKPVGFIGVCYYLSSYNGKTEVVANFLDSMVHPNYQGKGIYIKLWIKLEELALENEINFSLAFPNDNSFYPLVHKRKLEPACQMVGYLININTLPLRRIFRKCNFENAYFKWAAKKLKNITAPYLPAAFKQSDILPHIIHDELFFIYKTTPAHFLLKIEDTYVWIRLSTQLAVGFIQEVKEDKLLKIIERLKKIAKILYIQQVMFQFTLNSKQDLILKNHFPRFNSWNVHYSNQQSTFPINLLQLQYCDVDSF